MDGQESTVKKHQDIVAYFLSHGLDIKSLFNDEVTDGSMSFDAWMDKRLGLSPKAVEDSKNEYKEAVAQFIKLGVDMDYLKKGEVIVVPTGYDN